MKPTPLYLTSFLVFALAGLAIFAAGPACGQAINQGKIQSVDSRAFTVTLAVHNIRRQPTPVGVTSSTEIQVLSMAKKTDVKVGSNVVIGGTPDSSDPSVIDAMAIVVVQSGITAPNTSTTRWVSGGGILATVSAISPQLTVDTFDGSKTVNIKMQNYMTLNRGTWYDLQPGRLASIRMADKVNAAEITADTIAVDNQFN